jgi:hypothetical protein
VRHVGIAVASALVATGCNAILGIDDLSLATDAAVGEVDAASTICFGTASPACFSEQPSGALTLSGDLDTGTDTRCTSGAICAVGGDTIVVTGLTVTGTRPLALVALTMLTVENRLDASSTPLRLGPGANSSMCSPPVPAVVSTTSGGGAGGSFGSLGGVGGKGGTGGGNGGTPGEPQTPTALRGGCPGGAGAGASVAITGAGGSGGGAVSLYAGVKITIDEDVRVGGSGGGGGQSGNAGGGGGGSGGMLVLEAPDIDLGSNGDVLANGGGGGEGATLTLAGMNGGESTAFDDSGNGGMINSGGDGGDGFASGGPTENGKSGGGGGGGGGGAGVIWAKGSVIGTKISPPVVQR